MNDIPQSIEQVFQILLEKGIVTAVEKGGIEQKYSQLIEQIRQIVEKESDTVIQERLYQFLLNKCEILFWGKSDFDEEEVIRQIENKYGMILTKDTKKILLRGMRKIYDIVNQTLSPQQRMIIASNQEILSRLIVIQQTLEERIFQTNMNGISNENEMIPTKWEEKKTRGDWEIICDKWSGSLFNENNDSRSLAEVFVKTNYSFINIKKKENQLGKAHLQMVGTSINGYNIYKTSSYNGDDYTSEYVIHHFDDLMKDCINIDDFICKQKESDKKIALIFGLPGVGKSSIVAYMAGDYFKTESNSIFVLLSRLNYTGNLLGSICDYLNIKTEELENKYLILDGLDEIANVADAENMLVNFIDLINRRYREINVFITLRENYIDIRNASYIEYYAKCNIAKIEYFGKIQMVDFHKKFTRNCIDINRLELLIKEREVFGIPLLLYIIYSLNLNVTDTDDKYKLYEKIFSINGGIYDKCNAGNGGYSEESDFTVEEKGGFHFISQIIAYYIYKKGNLEINTQVITEAINYLNFPERSKRCYLYNNYYEVNDHIIKFIHKSFYEFFLSEYTGNMLRKLCVRDKDNSKQYAEFSNFLAVNKIEEEVFHHLMNKINEVDFEIVEFLSDYVDDVCKNGGCFYVTENNNSILRSEANLFYNLMRITGVAASVIGTKITVTSEKQLWDELANIEQMGYLKSHLLDGIDFIYPSCDMIPYSVLGIDKMKQSMIDARQKLWMNTFFSNLGFKNSDLSGIYFLGSQMEKCRFEGVQLQDCDFRYMHLDTVQFVNGSLQGSDFSKSKLNYVTFRGVNLLGVKFDGCEFQCVIFDSDNIEFIDKYLLNKQENISVYIMETRETVSYTKYKQYYEKIN